MKTDGWAGEIRTAIGFMIGAAITQAGAYPIQGYVSSSHLSAGSSQMFQKVGYVSSSHLSAGSSQMF